MPVYEIAQERKKYFKTVCLRGNIIFTNSGRIGNKGRISQTKFRSPEEAEREYRSLNEAILKEGYLLLSEGDGLLGDGVLPYETKLTIGEVERALLLELKKSGVELTEPDFQKTLSGFATFAKKSVSRTSKLFQLHWPENIAPFEKADAIDVPFRRLELTIQYNIVDAEAPKMLTCNCCFEDTRETRSAGRLVLEDYAAIGPLVKDFKASALFPILLNSDFLLFDVVLWTLE